LHFIAWTAKAEIREQQNAVTPSIGVRAFDTPSPVGVGLLASSSPQPIQADKRQTSHQIISSFAALARIQQRLLEFGSFSKHIEATIGTSEQLLRAAA